MAVDHGAAASLALVDSLGQNAMSLATEYAREEGGAECMLELVAAGADVNAEWFRQSTQPLHQRLAWIDAAHNLGA